MSVYHKQLGLKPLYHIMTLPCWIELVNPSHLLSFNFLDGLLSEGAIIEGDCERATINPPWLWHPSLLVPLCREECIQLTMACQSCSAYSYKVTSAGLGDKQQQVCGVKNRCCYLQDLLNARATVLTITLPCHTEKYNKLRKYWLKHTVQIN